MGRNLDSGGLSPQEEAAKAFDAKLAEAREKGRTSVHERRDAEPNKSYHEATTVNGVQIDIKWDGGIENYIIFFKPEKKPRPKDDSTKNIDLINQRVVYLNKNPEVAKQVFDYAVAQAGSTSDLYRTFTKVEDFFKNSEVLNNTPDVQDGSLKAQILAERLSFVGGNYGEQMKELVLIKEFAKTVEIEARQAVLKQVLIDKLKNVTHAGNEHDLLKFTEPFKDLLGEILQSPDVQKIVFDVISFFLKIGYTENAISLIKRFNISSQTLEQDQNIQNFARRALGETLGVSGDGLKESAQALRVPEDFLSSEEFHGYQRKAMDRHINMKNRINAGIGFSS